jgi:hypothetical protein
MMNKDAIYYYRRALKFVKCKLRQKLVACIRHSSKVCDIVLCSIRQIPDDSNNRFCFEVMAPNQKPLTLAAGWGDRWGMSWMGEYRRALKPAVHGDPHSDQLNEILLGEEQCCTGSGTETLGVRAPRSQWLQWKQHKNSSDKYDLTKESSYFTSLGYVKAPKSL